MSGQEIATIRRRVVVTANAINCGGAALVAIYFLIILPGEDPVFFTDAVGFSTAAVYSLIAGWSATRNGIRWSRPVWTWLGEDRPPLPAERERALRYPAQLARMTFVRWMLASVVFGVLGAIESKGLGQEIATSLVLSGLTVTAAQFLIAERVLRPVTARALDAKAPPSGALGVGSRLLLAWLLCSAIPIAMIALIPVGREFREADDLIGPTIFVAACALFAGALATKLTTQRVSGALRELRAAADAVAEGDLEARVPVDDASEVGRLQAGFNAMVAGLRERERLRDLIDRSVGRDVAEEALARGAELGGQVRTVSALFVDIVGSTRLAARERPEAVVDVLNRFFATVVEVVERHGGFVNKFEGDGALCVFGAPSVQPDHAAACLAAARDLRTRLHVTPGVDAAIGVSCGDGVAGWVGAESRFEYTVIGDPVNEAARLTELAKTQPGRLLASASTVEAAGPPEAGCWEIGEEVRLRGRPRPTRVARPRPAAAAGTPAVARRVSGAR